MAAPEPFLDYYAEAGSCELRQRSDLCKLE
jgi:hypothetical protein